ncbi:hypothetical protein VR010_12935 [Actinomycetaceae bacterium L2_0104]
MAGAIPLMELWMAALGVLLVTRFRSGLLITRDAGLLGAGVAYVLGLPFVATFAYSAMLTQGPFTDGEVAACASYGCPPLRLALFLTYLPSLVLAVSMFIVGWRFSQDTPWWKRICGLLGPYLATILLTWPIWENNVWAVIGP